MLKSVQLLGALPQTPNQSNTQYWQLIMQKTHTLSFSKMCNGFWSTMWSDNMKGAVIGFLLLNSHNM